MLGSIFSSSWSTLSPQKMLDLASSYLETARKAKDLEIALVLCDDAEASLSQMKKALRKAHAPETLADQTLRDKIATAYFEHGEVLDQLGQPDRAQTSYKKAEKWGHPGVAAQSGRRSPAAVQLGRILPAVPSFPAHADASIFEKNKLVDLLFTKTLETFQQWKVSSVWPSAFLVYAHDNPHVGTADAGTAKFLIHHLGELGVNLYSDQKPKGQQTQASFSTRADTTRLDDILTSQLCLLPTAIGAIQPVDKVIVCGSQVLGHYLQWGKEGEHYQAYCGELKTAYGLAQQNVTQAEAEIRKVVNTYSRKADFHHVLTEMAFLKIRTDYLEQHGIIPVSLSAGGYERCLQDFIEATTVRIEDMARFASKQASGEAVYENQGRHLVFFKLLERLLAQHDAEALLSTFWTGYDDWIKRLNSEAAVPTVSACLPIWDGITQQAQQALKALQEKVDAHELQTALTRYASLDRLAIQRLSGPPLSMKDCYINLAIVEHEKGRKEEKKSKEREAAQSQFHRLPSVEAIDSNPQKLISLEKLFEPQKVSNDKTVTPKRILIRGRAGVGKTTLSKKVIYEYMQKGQWRDRFDYVLWIPLRTLKGKSNSDLATLFHETYFQSHPQGQSLAKTLAAQINGPAKNKTLFVLDGWDEIAQEWGEHEPMSEFLKQLLNQSAVLITSRPYVDLGQADPMDLELETVGFSPANVTAYLDNPGIVPTADATEIKHFIQANAFIHELINVPIQLDALCYSWDEIKRMQKEGSGAMTVTALYQAMMSKLWRKDMLHLGKREGRELLTASHINALSSFRLEKLVKAEQDFLSTLAFKGLQRNQIEFHRRDLHKLVEQLETEGADLPFTLEANLEKLSFLHANDAEASQRSYHFMHLTFQEFLAAKFLVRHLQAHANTIRKSTSAQTVSVKTQFSINPNLEELESFIATHKYNPRYEIVWWMVAGLLEGKALELFFMLLEEAPRDLIGIRHQQVMMGCLNEARVQLNQAAIDTLEREFMQWLDFEMKNKRGAYSHLGCQRVFPEHLLIHCLSQPEAKKDEVIHILGARPALSSKAVLVLLSALKSEEWRVRSAATIALGNHPLSSDTVSVLLSALEDKDSDIRSAAACVLGMQRGLSAEVVLTLLFALKDKEENVWSAAAAALGNQRELSSEVVLALRFALEYKDRVVRSVAASALGSQRELPSEVVLALLSALKDKDGDVRSAAARAFGRHQRKLSSEATLALCFAFQDEKRNVRFGAASTLGSQCELSSEVVLALLFALKDEYRNVRSAAARALGSQRELSSEAILALLPTLKDKEEDVRTEAARALGNQRKLSPEVALALLSALKDENGLAWTTAKSVLVNQRELSAEVVLTLFFAWNEKDSDILSAAKSALVNQRKLSSEVVLALLSALKDKELYVRSAAASALGNQCELSSEVVLALLSALKDERWLVRSRAASALGNQRELSSEAVLALLSALRHKDGGAQSAAASALGNQRELSSDAILALLSALKDEDSDVRSEVAKALGPYMNRLFTLLPRMKRDQIKALYTEFLLPRSVEQIPSFYIQDSQLYFYTAMGPGQPIKLSAYQSKEITEAFRAVQVQAGITSRLKSQWQWF